MADPVVNELDAAITRKLLPGIADDFFKNSPVLAYLRKNRYFVWDGGTEIQDALLYKPMRGGAYAKGANFDITKRQTKTAIRFSPRQYEVNVTEYLEDEAIVRGPRAIFSLVEADLQNAALTMNAILAIALYRHGQNRPGDDRSLEINGLEEALADGTNATWSGATFPSYGGQARVDVGAALNSPAGLVAANVAGNMSYRVLEQTYQSVVIGAEHPKLGVTTNRGMGFINENFQPQQRIDTIEPTIGFPGITFKQATLVEDQYCPGADGVNDPDLGNYLVTPTAGTSGAETFWWLNPGPEGDKAFLKLFFMSHPKFQFGWTGFKTSQDNTAVAGQILFMGNFLSRANRMQRALFQIQG